MFCYHRATASELLSALERCLKAESVSRTGPPEKVWRAAWESLLPDEDDSLVTPIIDWVCTPGLFATRRFDERIGRDMICFRFNADALERCTRKLMLRHVLERSAGRLAVGGFARVVTALFPEQALSGGKESMTLR